MFQLPMRRSRCLGPTRVQILCAAPIYLLKCVTNAACWGEFSLLFERGSLPKPRTRTFFVLRNARCSMIIVVRTIHFAIFVGLLLVCFSPSTLPTWVTLRGVENSKQSSSSSSFEGHPLQARHKQNWGRGFIFLLPQIAALPGSDAGSDVIKPASSFVIQNRQTACSM